MVNVLYCVYNRKIDETLMVHYDGVKDMIMNGGSILLELIPKSNCVQCHEII